MAFALAKTTKPTIENEKVVKTPSTVQIGPHAFKSVFTETTEKFEFKLVGVKVVVMLDNGDEYAWASYVSKGRWGSWKRSECNSAARHRGHDISDVLGDLIAKNVADAEQVILDAIDLQDQIAARKMPTIIQVEQFDDVDGNDTYCNENNGFAFIDEAGGAVYKSYQHDDDGLCWATPYKSHDDAMEDAEAYFNQLLQCTDC